VAPKKPHFLKESDITIEMDYELSQQIAICNPFKAEWNRPENSGSDCDSDAGAEQMVAAAT
jgi:hypothetical protein